MRRDNGGGVWERFRAWGVLLAGTCGLTLTALGYEPPVFPFAPAAGESGSSAISMEDGDLLGWAVAVASVEFGEAVATEWRDAEKALGPATGSVADVVSLGRGGVITLDLGAGMADGPGPDFAVFGNGFSDTFLELAFVEVSSDGEHFVRFPAYSLTAEAVGPFGQVDPSFVEGFAGKYRVGFGTPFDLGVLARAHAAAQAGLGGFSAAYRQHLLETYPFLDPERVHYLRLVDVIGDGSVMDAEGFAIFDPYPTSISAGFDLEAVGILNPATAPFPAFRDWAAGCGLEASWTADSDRDGWSNGLEYVMGTRPDRKADRPTARLERLPGNAAGPFRLVYSRLLEASATWNIEVAVNGFEWRQPDSAPVRLSAIPENSATRVVESLTLEGSGNGTILVRLLAGPPDEPLP